MSSSAPHNSFLSKVSNSYLFKAIHSDPILQKVSSILSSFQKKAHSLDIYSPINKVSTSVLTQELTLKDFEKAQPAQANSALPYIINNTLFDGFKRDENTELYVIYLNRAFDTSVLQSLHKMASFSIMADGAANRFHSKYSHLSVENEILPDALVGDFDSIKQDVLAYYQAKGVKVHQDHSQDDSDLEKCLKFLDKKINDEKPYEKKELVKIVITGGFGGRMDHVMNNIHILHKFAEKYNKHLNISIHLIDNNSVGTCILPGKTRYIRSQAFEKSEGCGMFPLLGQQAKVNSKGLKWNVNENIPMSFKKFISSSNEMIDEVIEFETNEIIFWVTTNAIHKSGVDE